MVAEKSSTTPETAEPTYESEGGATYDIRPSADKPGLFHIVQTSGGKCATVCNQWFTSHRMASEALIRYLRAGNNLGYAKFPGATPRKPRRG